MTSWAGSVFVRTLQFWALWAVLLCGLGDTVQRNVLTPEQLFRGTLLLVTSVLVFVEWLRVDAALKRAVKALKLAAVPVPSRWERGVLGCLPTSLVLAGWMTFFCAKDVTNQADPDLQALLLRGAFLTVTTVLLLGLVLAGFSLVRIAHAQRSLPRAAREDLGGPIPWTVAAWSAPCLAFAMIGPPSMSTMLVGARLAGAVIEASTTEVQLLVELGPDDHISEIEPHLRRFEATGVEAYPQLAPQEDADLSQTWLVEVTERDALALGLTLVLDHENVDVVELNSAVSGPGEPPTSACDSVWGAAVTNDPYSQAQVGLQRAEVTDLHGSGFLQRAVTVAIIDSGVDGSHPDLRSVMTPYAVSDARTAHGTWVAGVAAAVANNGIGIASPNDGALRLASYPVFPGASAHDIAYAVVEAVEDGARVINLSFSGEGEAPDTVADAISYARRQGVLVVAAGGNGRGQDHVADNWPGNLGDVLAVTGTSSLGTGWSGSTLGGSGGVSAQAEDVCTTHPGGGAVAVSGTSFAAPLVSGIAAALISECPRATPAEVASALARTAKPVLGGVEPEVRAGTARVALLASGACR